MTDPHQMHAASQPSRVVTATLVTNINTHYRDGLYRELNDRLGTDFIFYSDGGEWYNNGSVLPVDHLGTEYLSGRWIGRSRIVPALPLNLLRARGDVVIKCINGKFAVPCTYLIARLRRKPLILWTGTWQAPSGLLHRLLRPLVAHLYKSADAILTYGPHVTGALVAAGVERGKIFEATQAMDNTRFLRHVPEEVLTSMRQELGIPANSRVIGFVGRLVAEKGVSVLIEAFAMLLRDRVDVHLVLIGDGPLRPSLETRALRNGNAGRLHVLGPIPHDRLPQYYKLFDVVAVPSLATPQWAEPWGFVVNEAMASGTCVVASDAVGAARGGLLCHGETGLAVPQGHPRALARAIVLVLDDHDLRSRLSEAGQRAVANLTQHRMVHAFEEAISYARAATTGANSNIRSQT